MTGGPFQGQAPERPKTNNHIQMTRPVQELPQYTKIAGENVNQWRRRNRTSETTTEDCIATEMIGEMGRKQGRNSDRKEGGSEHLRRQRRQGRRDENGGAGDTRGSDNENKGNERRQIAGGREGRDGGKASGHRDDRGETTKATEGALKGPTTRTTRSDGGRSPKARRGRTRRAAKRDRMDFATSSLAGTTGE
jgi:hypothetical protein